MTDYIFLKEIAGLDFYNGPIAIYNRNFFSKYIGFDNSEIINYLLNIALVYTNVITELQKRHNKEDNDILQKLNEELKKLKAEIEIIKKESIDLCDKKIENDTKRKNMYLNDEIDFDETKKLAISDSEIEATLTENNAKIQINRSEEKSKNDEKKQIDEKREKLDLNIEKMIEELKGLYSKLNGKNLDIFKGLNIDSLKEEYEQGLKDIIPNDIVRKVYVSYFFDGLKKEIQNIFQTYNVAQQFIIKTKKENGYDVPELITANDQIYIKNTLISFVYGQIPYEFIGFAYSPQNNYTIEMGNSYFEAKQFFEMFYNFVDNLDIYSKDHSKAISDYEKINTTYYEIESKLSKLSSFSEYLWNTGLSVGDTRLGSNPRHRIDRSGYEAVSRFMEMYHNSEKVRTPIFDYLKEKKHDKTQNNQVTNNQIIEIQQNNLNDSMLVSLEDMLNSSEMKR